MPHAQRGMSQFSLEHGPTSFPPCPPLLQGMADTFLLLGMPFDSPEAAELNKAIFETIYHAAVQVGGWV